MVFVVFRYSSECMHHKAFCFLIMMIALTLWAVLLCVYIYTYFRERRARRLLSGLPSRTCLPFVGNFYQFLNPKGTLDSINDLCEIADQYDKPALIWAGSHPILLMCNPEDVKLVTNSFVGKPYFINFVKPALGNGIFSAPGPLWKRNIKKIAGAGSFTAASVENYQAKFSIQAFKLVDAFKAQAGKEPFDITQMIVKTSLETVYHTALGVEINFDAATIETYDRASNRYLQLLEDRIFNFLLHPDFVYKRTPMYREMMQTVNDIQDITRQVMAKVNEKRVTMKNSAVDVNANPGGQYKSYYERLLELHEKDPSFTMEQMNSEVHSIIFAGQETVSSAFTFIFMVIGHYTEVQQKLYEEIKEIYGDSKRPVTTADLDRMPYCEAVINETLRVYPPALGAARCADRDLTIRSYTIPKGTSCALAIWGMCRSKRLWGQDALDFRPERWFEPGCPGNTAAFAPFSYGRRSCIGKKYAMSFMKTTIAQCVRELEFQSDISKLRLKMRIMLKPVTEPIIQVRLRDRTEDSS